MARVLLLRIRERGRRRPSAGLTGGWPIDTVGIGQDALARTQRLSRGHELGNPSFALLGVELANLSVGGALQLVCERLRSRDTKSLIFFANAHTLDLAARCESFKRTLNQASLVLGDGIGVRLGARLNGVRIGANLCGTDFIPHLLSIQAERRFRYYLLGATPDSIVEAARNAAVSFPHWRQVGFHHGYLRSKTSLHVVEHINEARPDLLLVGMGSPLQETWLVDHRPRLRVPVCASVGGLFDFWSGRRARAPLLLRKWCLEWLHIALTEPHKWPRYAVGAPRYLAHVAAARFATTRRARI